MTKEDSMKTIFDLISILGNEKSIEIYRKDLAYGDRASRYFSRDGLVFLVLRGISIGEDSLQITPTHFVIKEKKVYLYKPETDSFLLLKNGHDDILKLALDNHGVNVDILNSYYDQIDSLEDCIYERNVPRHFMDTWFDLKKNILRIERFYVRYVVIFNDYIKAYTDLEEVDSVIAESIVEKANVSLNQASGLVSRLDTLHHYYGSVKNDKLNKNIYFLTLVSGIFLPLNLIVGFFGMNTENLFFKDHPQGTIYVVYLLCGVIFSLTIGLRLARFIDNTFLRRSLGKYRIYQSIFKNVEKIENILDGDS